MKSLTRIVLAITIAGILSFQSSADDWAQFRGANATGISEKADLPTEWNEKKNLKWQTDLPGFGSSSPIVYGDRIYVTCYSGYGLDKKNPGNPDDLKRHLVCLNKGDGNVVWSTEAGNKHPEDPYKGFICEHGYASNTPVTDGKMIFAFFGKGGLYAYDMNGKQLWTKDLGKDSGKMKWGSAASLVLVDEMVIVNANEESHTIRAFKKDSGEQAWTIDAEMDLAYSTPAIVSLKDGKKELVIALPAKVIGVDPKTGKQKWFAKTHLLNNVSPTPIIDGDVAYMFGGYQGVGSIAIRCGGEGDVTDSHVIWKSKLSSYVATPVLHDGHFYWVDARGMARCSNAGTGEEVYRERLKLKKRSMMTFYASMVLAGDNVYAVSRKNGTYVIAAKPEFELVATNEFASDESDFNATPAISGNEMFIRSDKAIYCVSK